MIYGAGDFVGHSWEIVAKSFREHIGSRIFATVSECGKEFIDYLKLDQFENDELEDFNVLGLFYNVLNPIYSARRDDVMADMA